METDNHPHQPVLINEVLDCLQPAGNDFIVDATFGRGGYTTAILGKLKDDGRVLAFDVDPDAIAHGEKLFAAESRLTLVQKNYDKLVETLEELGMPAKANGIVFDLGVSSPQLDNASRGFSFRNDGPLDMRMDPHNGLTAAEWLQTVPYNELVRVISILGEEKMAKRIAREIIAHRDKGNIESTALLAEIISRAIPEKERKRRKIHPATKTFQAIRMHINDELGHLKAGLTQAINTLATGGVAVVVSFHSLEDRIVKRMFRKSVEGVDIPDRLPVMQSELRQEYAYVAKLMRPGESELRDNPRARSAKLRAIRRLI